MRIEQIFEDKKRCLDLLLLADEVDMIYLKKDLR